MSRDEQIGKQIRRYREAAGMSQNDLAEYATARGLAFTASTIYKIETGNRKVLASELPVLGSVLNVPASNLLGLGEERTPILTSGARLEEAQRNLQAASLSYGRAMLSYAQAADSIEQLSENDARYIRDGLLKQTPGWIATADTIGSIEATLKLNRVEVTGESSQAVLDALRSEHDHFHKDNG